MGFSSVERYNEYQREYRRARRKSDPDYRAQCVRWQKEYLDRYPEKRAEKYAARTERRREARALLWDLKDQPCVDCGGRFHPAAMDFDHVRGTKRYAIVVNNILRDDILFELAKCELRCANCHRTRHAGLQAAEEG